MNSELSNDPKLICNHCPDLVASGWRERAGHLREEFRRHKITDCERRLAEALLDITLGWCRETVCVPELKFFCAMTGMEKSHVHDAISGLHLQRIIRVVRVKGQLTYSLREDSEQWKASPRELMSDRIDRLKQLREINGLATEGFPGFFKGKPGAGKTSAGVTSPVIDDGIAAEDELPFLDL